ncbi:hypothetical protein ABIE65_003226 [Constrictibacter sp. MBR-5]|jgi:hypothetical protein
MRNGAAIRRHAILGEIRTRVLFCGLRIGSDLPFPGARPIEHGDEPDDVRIILLPDRRPGSSGAVLHRSARPSQPDIAIEPDGAHVLDWSGHVQVRIDNALRSIAISSTSDRLHLLPSIVMGWAIGYLLVLRGAVCLHGSVVRFQGRTVALLGDSGTGKSTLAAAAVRAGADLLSDDLVAFSDPRSSRSVAAGMASLRLTPETAEALGIGADALKRPDGADKLLWTPTCPQSAGAPCLSADLDAIYLLASPTTSDADEPSFTIDDRLAPGPALLGLIRACYPPGMPGLLGPAHLQGLGAIARTVLVRPLRHARRWRDLPRLVDAILR